jgi:UDP-N-acetyl-D-galactosamine dehydrogenase
MIEAGHTIAMTEFREYLNDLRGYLKADGVLFDLKGVLPLGEAHLRL